MLAAVLRRQSPWEWDRTIPLQRILSECCEIEQEKRPSIDGVLLELHLILDPQSVSLFSKRTTAIVCDGPLGDLEPDQVPPELKKEGSDWWAIFNPSVPKVLDISLSLTLTHERHVGLKGLFLSRL